MHTKTLLYATTNPGKVMEVRKYLQSYSISLVSPTQLGLTIAVEETGQTLEEYAPTYIRVALDKLTETAKIHRFRRKAVIPKESLAFIAAAFRIAADSAEGRHP